MSNFISSYHLKLTPLSIIFLLQVLTTCWLVANKSTYLSLVRQGSYFSWLEKSLHLESYLIFPPLDDLKFH